IEARFAQDDARPADPGRNGAAAGICRSRCTVRGTLMVCRAIKVICAVSALWLAACEREPQPPPPRTKQVFHLNGFEKDFGYSQAVLIDRTLYISGSVAVDANGNLVAHGAGFQEVVKETIYTTSMDALLKASDLRFEYYDKERLPTASWVQVQRLADPGFLVEIEVIAELP